MRKFFCLGILGVGVGLYLVVNGNFGNECVVECKGIILMEVICDYKYYGNFFYYMLRSLIEFVR